ncbi:MAG: hypothetical protein WCV68_01035 [Candidatus Paceibacterota bacterium]|jgi:hypothetical protein
MRIEKAVLKQVVILTLAIGLPFNVWPVGILYLFVFGGFVITFDILLGTAGHPGLPLVVGAVSTFTLAWALWNIAFLVFRKRLMRHESIRNLVND